MKCFYHQDRHAVGSCKSCGKGVCPDCAVDLGKGLACRSHCEENAQAVIDLIDQNIRLAPRTAKLLDSNRRVRTGASGFNLVLGVVFVLWGFTDPDRLSFLVVVGVCFLLFGGFSIIQAIRMERQNQENTAKNSYTRVGS